MTFDKEKYASTLEVTTGQGTSLEPAETTTYTYYDLPRLAENTGIELARLPYTIRILLESAVRQYDADRVTSSHLRHLLRWQDTQVKEEYPFRPQRVILQDFTGVPAIVDLASMRDAMAKLGFSPRAINPDIPVDLVIDHSVQVDFFGSEEAIAQNQAKEFERNKERYEFIKWAQNAFDNFKVIPNNTGIVHQVNIEYLAKVIDTYTDAQGRRIAAPDSVFGTDSHTPMVNSLGVLGWGVGGIEAEAAMLGQFSYNSLPEVVGVELTGQLRPEVNATDLVLAITEKLRAFNVVGKFVEFYGEGARALTLPDRATISNMAPEYGATVGFFPIDAETLDYLRVTNRPESQVALVEAYAKRNGLWADPAARIDYSARVSIDLAEIQTAISGPKRPQDRIYLRDVESEFAKTLTRPAGPQGFGLDEAEARKTAQLDFQGEHFTLGHGAIFIAAITSCTNTSNPYVMMAAGLIARNASQRGLQVPAYVKTSLAPGSKTVTDYYINSGLAPYLNALGFNVVGYGCTTCIGNSGPLHPELSKSIAESGIVSASVLSGNRNFEGRINPDIQANYLASPPLVIAFALAGRIDIDFSTTPLGYDAAGAPVFLRDIWPTQEEIADYVHRFVTRDIYSGTYADLYSGNEQWLALPAGTGEVYEWNENSTYIQNPPYFEDMEPETGALPNISGLRVLAKFGDSVTTDHISPAGAIVPTSPAGLYLQERGVEPRDFNSYGSRRGNHEVMMRGTFANIRLTNQIAGGKIGGYTTYWPTGEVMPIYDAAMGYKKSGTGLVILAGKDYGMGSSRDWAAKGASLLNVKAVIARSYERIHRANLVMMGILPLEFMGEEDADSLGLTGTEVFDIALPEKLGIHEVVEVTARDPETGAETSFRALARLDSTADLDYYHNAGILPYVIRNKALA
ncbi:aconitate hydratase [Actinobaculum suis]|uniref:Aconitate hydratase n=1 Tax=Actinobaculum suis TaxID=1657 RepID=A0A7Z8YAX0_9ACTO|nr:aconitate hydratase AcnA [Actinobaculum suis]VDG76940.1 aconitate hydratase [Actinobaculum suis]